AGSPAPTPAPDVPSRVRPEDAVEPAACRFSRKPATGRIEDYPPESLDAADASQTEKGLISRGSAPPAVSVLFVRLLIFEKRIVDDENVRLGIADSGIHARLAVLHA